MNIQAHIAVDLGAESGRVVLGSIVDEKLQMQETHRFMHRPVPMPVGLCWDLTGLWNEILTGIRRAVNIAKESDLTIASIGVDTWGVDWSLVTPANTLAGLPRCYRDPQFRAAFDTTRSSIGADKIYEATGIQLLPFNTLYQVASELRREPARFAGNRLMFMPDIFHWLLSGRVTVERTNASTSQLFDTAAGDWSSMLVDKLGIPAGVLGDVIDPGATIGMVTPAVSTATGLETSVAVIAPPTHDTASAVAAVPARIGTKWAYLSSGTWSLLGVELERPLITEVSYDANFTNELGIAGTVRFLKNIAGLWLVQEVRRQFERDGQTYDYAQLTQLAAEAKPFRTLIAVNDPAFLAPKNMIAAIRDFAQATHQPEPTSPGQLVRCCLESLALEYRRVLATLSSLTEQTFDVLHIVGGGGKNGLLNQFTADATGCVVEVGPTEGTAMGNILTQAIGTGQVRDLIHLRTIVRESTALQTIKPDNAQAWHAAAENYQRLL